MLTVIFISAISGFIVITIDLTLNFHGRGSALITYFDSTLLEPLIRLIVYPNDLGNHKMYTPGPPNRLAA